MKLIIFGRPGSGKSTAARCIEECARGKDFSSKRVKDYSILFDMFKKEQALNPARKERRFKATKHGGFDVVKFDVLDEALGQMQDRVLEDARKYDLVLVEFARDKYQEVFGKFTPAFLRDAYFLFVEATLEVCKERIHNRVRQRRKTDHHFVSDEIMDSYYSTDNWSYMKNVFEQEFSFHDQTTIIRNDGNLEIFEIQVKDFAERFMNVVHRQAQSNISVTEDQVFLNFVYAIVK